MSIYNFPPTASVNSLYPFLTWENGFSEEELDIIVDYCDNNLQISKAAISGVSTDVDYSKIRRSNTGWLTYNQNTQWIYDRLSYIARNLNAKFYNFDLFGFVEDMQYTVYDSAEEGHYGWHVDLSNTSVSPRKFTMVLQLTSPDDYEGGEIQLLNSTVEEVVIKQRGLVCAFPSWTLHRVTPVTKGIRKTLVVWVAGPSFR